MKSAIKRNFINIAWIFIVSAILVDASQAAEEIDVTHLLNKSSDLLSSKAQITACASRIPFASVGLRCNLLMSDINMTIETNKSNYINSVTIFQGSSSEDQFLNSSCLIFEIFDKNMSCDAIREFFLNMKKARFTPLELEKHSISGSWSRSGSFLAIKSK